MDNTRKLNIPNLGLKILTLNARGLNINHKRLEIFLWN